MRKSLVMLIVSSLVLAGCAGISEDDAKEIAEELVDIPGCNDETAYNYDETATNANACYTEAILKDAVADFILFIDQGPAWGETGGLTTEGSEVDEDGEMTTFSTTMAMSPDGIYVMTEMNEGMMQFSMGELVTENSENGKTNIQSTWMGTTFMMHSDSTFAEHWNEVSFNENNADSDEDADSEDDMEMGDDEMDMGMPNTEVDIPEDFDPATALYEAGLATDNGYSFTTTIDHGEGYSTSMTFTLSSMFEVTKVVMEETDSEGMVSTSSITVLTSAEVDALLDDDENLVQHALPFVLNPMGPMMDMVCYDMNSHQIMMQIDNQDDCENGGYMWVPANSGPGGDGDGNGDGHNHGGDNDNDGFTVAQGDCDDSNSDVYPGAPEIQNGIDDDCDNEVDEGDDTMTISGYLTDNWASSDEMYVDPEFTISSGFENIDNVNFELTDDEGSTLMDITIQPSDFIDTGNDIMLYFVPITDLMLDNGCYVLTATANTINGYELSWERGDICYDYSGDGGITAEEFMQLTDTDGSSTMTFEEFVNFFESEELMSEEMESDFSIMFADSDTDGSNDLDISELQFFVDELDNYMDSMEDGDGDGHDHGDWPTFVCGDGEEIPFEYVNDGEEDCTDGADEQQYNADGSEINWFDCMDGSQIWISQVNDGNHDCSDGDDEMLDHDDEHMGPYYYENCAESDQGLSSLDCWDNEWDVDGDGVPEDSDSYWNYECQQLADGSWECMTDHINYYDNCAYEGENYYECWLDEWDTDGDGAYDLGSDGYMDYECELLEDGRWACSHSEDMDMFQVYDQCSDATGDYECWMNDWVDSEGNVIMTDGYPLGDCTQLEDGTWECLVMEDDDEDDDLPSEEDFFSGADADNDGYVSAQDIVDFLLSGSFTAEELLSVADSDGSEGVSWEEFVADWNE